VLQHAARHHGGMPASRPDENSASALSARSALLRTEAHFGDRLIRCYAQRPANLDAMLSPMLDRGGDALALVCGTHRISYRELNEAGRRTATGLAQAGLRGGERLALYTGNCVEFVIAALAAWRLGAIVVPINTRNSRDELAYMLGQCKAAMLIYEREFAARVPDTDALPDLRHCYATGGTAGPHAAFESLLLHAGDTPAAQPGEEDTAVILYTSGTTGHPKGAMLTHLNLVHSVLHFRQAMGLGAQERSLLAVPISHVTGLVAILLPMLHLGGTVVMLREFKAPDFLALAANEHITHTLVVPAIYNLLLRHPDFGNYDLSSWRVGGFGGAPMPEPTITELAARLPNLTPVNAYGATETTSPTTCMPLGLQAANLDSVGQVLPCADVRVMDDSGVEVAAGTAGELWIGGPMVVPGYWDNPEATKREFIAGYWKSGDIGSIDAQGFVRVFDRKKDMINRGGYKVYSAEVESVLVAHPDVLEAALIGVPDPVLGEKTHAHVVARGNVDAEAIRRHVAAALADYKIPDFVSLREEPLPRNPNGKVLKRLLRA
jgi:O-succinylbenzoic acid--CoA ligase